MIKAGLNIGNSKISCVVCEYKTSKNRIPPVMFLDDFLRKVS